MKRTLTAIETAAALQVSKRTVYNLIRTGRLAIESGPRGWRVLADSVRHLQEERHMADAIDTSDEHDAESER